MKKAEKRFRYLVVAKYLLVYVDRTVADAASRAVARDVLGSRKESKAHGSSFVVASNARENDWDLADRETAERLAISLRTTLRARVTVRKIAL